MGKTKVYWTEAKPNKIPAWDINWNSLNISGNNSNSSEGHQLGLMAKKALDST